MIRRIPVAAFVILSLLLASSASASEIKVMRAWVSMPILDEPAPVYFMIRNGSDRPRKIVGASSEGFDAVQIHRGTIRDGQHASDDIGEFEIPSLGDVLFAERGLFLLLIGEHEFEEDEKLEIELEFGDGEKVRFEATVRDA